MGKVFEISNEQVDAIGILSFAIKLYRIAQKKFKLSEKIELITPAAALIYCYLENNINYIKLPTEQKSYLTQAIKPEYGTLTMQLNENIGNRLSLIRAIATEIDPLSKDLHYAHTQHEVSKDNLYLYRGNAICHFASKQIAEQANYAIGMRILIHVTQTERIKLNFDEIFKMNLPPSFLKNATWNQQIKKSIADCNNFSEGSNELPEFFEVSLLPPKREIGRIALALVLIKKYFDSPQPFMQLDSEFCEKIIPFLDKISKVLAELRYQNMLLAFGVNANSYQELKEDLEEINKTHKNLSPEAPALGKSSPVNSFSPSVLWAAKPASVTAAKVEEKAVEIKSTQRSWTVLGANQTNGSKPYEEKKTYDAVIVPIPRPGSNASSLRRAT